MLIQAGADTEITNADGLLPIDLCKNYLRVEFDTTDDIPDKQFRFGFFVLLF